MMQPAVKRGGAWLVFAGAVACAPPTPAGTSGAVKTEPAKSEPKVEPEPVKAETVKAEPEPVKVEAVAVSEETLDERPLLVSQQGAWELRRAGPGTGGGYDGPGGGGIGFGGGEFKGSSGRGGEADAASAPAEARSERVRMADEAPPPATGAPAKMKSGGALGASARPPAPVAEAPLKAGSTDDNADFKGYLKFLATWTGRPEVRGSFQPLDVEGRAFISVVDGDRRPVPAARVTVSDPSTRATLWRATTYGDGRAPYYPRLFGPELQPVDRVEVTATFGGETVTQPWDGKGDLTLAAKAPREDAGMGLDVLFLIDTTGSMGDELERIKTSLLQVTAKVQGRREGLTLRYAAVAYKDINDDYVTMAHPFTDDVKAFDAALQALSAGGGGDLPESMNQGLARAVEGVQWRPEAAKVVFLVADAPPQMRLKGDVLYGDSAVKAVGAGIRIHAVAASGLDPLGTLVLRQVAQLTRGNFIFIEYGSTQATASKHGVTGPVEGGNNLDDILLKQLTAEIDGWGR
ncbi:MAG: VWA domain-containing protein [Myxococcales bacterium]|nr:VWA domain-containing protein [Myxococcales bacterium]